MNRAALKKPDWAAMRKQGAELHKRLQIAHAIGVTIEPAQIAFDLVRRDDTGVRAVRSFTLPISPDALLADPEGAGAILAGELAAAGIREKRCVVCVPPSWALTSPTDVPDVPAEDLRDYLELKAEREFPVPPSELRLAHSVYQAPGAARAGTLAGAPVKKLEAVERMLAKAGRRAVSISLGLDRCLATNGAVGALHFLAGTSEGGAVDVVTVVGGGVAALRTLAGSGDAASLFPEVRISLGRLPQALRADIRSARFEGDAQGAGQLFAGLQGPLERAGIASQLAAPGSEIRPGVLAAQRWLKRQPVAFEFVPPKVNAWEQRLRQFGTGRRRWIVLGAIGLVLLPLLAFMIRSSIESSYNREWETMRTNVSDLENIQQKIRQFRPWFDSTPNDVTILENLAGAFPDAGDAWAKTVEISDSSKVTCTGFARNPAALATLRETLRRQPGVSGLQVQQVRGESPVQFTLVYKWERPS